MQPIQKIDFITTICSWDALEERLLLWHKPNYFKSVYTHLNVFPPRFLKGKNIIIATIMINFNNMKLNVEGY